MQTRTRVISSWRLTPTIHAVRVERPERFTFEPGQHVMVSLETENGDDDRFLSIASAPSSTFLEFAVRESDSAFKHAFRSLQSGDPVTIVGPSGSFRRRPDRAAVLLSGGIGITPLISMARHHALRGPRTVLFFANRSPDEIPYRNELDHLAVRSNFEVYYTVSVPDEEWRGATGHISDEFLDAGLRSVKPPYDYYVCGPPDMVTAISRLLIARGVPAEQVMTEHFSGY